MSFNSTRCIRNLPQLAWVKVASVNLSTPHGALGTYYLPTGPNPTEALSTPHGALGTVYGRTRALACYFLSTPHGALGTLNDHIN